MIALLAFAAGLVVGVVGALVAGWYLLENGVDPDLKK